MVKYYYDKYNAIGTTRYYDTALWELVSEFGQRQFQRLPKNYSFDAVQNRYILSDNWADNVDVPAGSFAYEYEGQNILRYSTVNSGLYSNQYIPGRTDRKVSSKNSTQTTYQRGSLVQSGIIAEDGTYPANGRHTDGFWYVRGAIANTAPTTPGEFTSPAGTLNGGVSVSATWGASTDAEGNAITYYPEYRYYKNGVAQAWAALANNASLTRALTLSSDKTMDKIEFQVRAFDGSAYSAYRNSPVFAIKHNSAPTVVLNATNNLTLYENDTFTIDGSATDPDVGNVVNVKYQINSEMTRAIAVNISTGAAMPYNKQLLFKGGQLFDGATVVTTALNAGVAHTLKVWAEDDQGGKSAEQIRTFYVVPNRPPALTVDPFGEQADMINNDMITINGASSDPDGNDVVVAYKLNSNAAVQIHSGLAGPWTFDLQLKSLKDGENIIVVEVTDTYGFKSSKTIKLNKTANLTPLLASVQRYEIMPPSGSAQGVLLWIQRDSTLTVSAEISMTTGSEQEQFTSMALSNTAPVTTGIVEDEFTFQADAAKENIYVKLNITGTGAVTLISGVLS